MLRKLLAVLVAILGYTSIANAQGDSWVAKALLPEARGFSSAASVNDKIYFFGGSDDSDYRDTVWEYDPISDTYTEKASMLGARVYHSAAAVSDRIYVFGGYSPLGEVLTVVEEYNPLTDTWTPKSAMPVERALASATAVGEKIYMIGGSGNTGRLKTVDIYDTTTDSWFAGPLMPEARQEHAAGAIGTKIYVVGGTDEDDGFFSNDLVVLDTKENTWSIKSEMQSDRTLLSAAVVNGKLYALGGCCSVGLPLNINEEYNPSTDSWVFRAPMFTNRSGFAIATAKGKIYALGGFKYFTRNENEEYTPLLVDFLSFPLRGQTPTSAATTSVFDHAMTTRYCPEAWGGASVVAFTGECGEVRACDTSPLPFSCGDLYGYEKADGSLFSANGNYVGSRPCGAITANYDGHPGWDYSVCIGTVVVAAADGTVSLADSVDDDANGRRVYIDHADGYQTLHLHLDRLNVTLGQAVNAGDIIGWSGNTGGVAPHLHFEVRQNGISVDPYGWDGEGEDPYVALGGPENKHLWFTNERSVFSDGFECGTRFWSLVRGAVQTTTPGLEGSGTTLAVTADGTNAKAYVESEHPAAERKLTASFTLNPNALAMNTSPLDVLHVASTTAVHMRMSLRRTAGGGYGIGLAVTDDAGVLQLIGSVDVAPQGETRLTVEWTAASGSGQNNGVVRLLKDGVLVAEATDLDTDTLFVETVRLGLPNGSAGTAAIGTFFVDEYTSVVPNG